jgi:hypothetical protein
VVVVRCPCGQGHDMWGEFWWVEGRYLWVFFDDLEGSDTYREQLTHCPECGRELERKNLGIIPPFR